MASASAPPLKKGLKVFVIPKNLGNPYFTTADSVKVRRGARRPEGAWRDGQRDRAARRRTAASADPRHPGGDHEGANALVVSASDAAALCPTLNSAIKKKITVVTYDSDAPTCRSLFINQADSGAIGPQ